MTPLWWIIIGGISGVELTPISGMLLNNRAKRTHKTRNWNSCNAIKKCREEYSSYINNIICSEEAEFHDTIVVDYNRWYLWCRAHSHIWHVT
jgi:hypothetical protein